LQELQASPEAIGKILQTYQVVAVVGLSPDPSRPSFQVARYLKEHGYRIIPVNPGCTEILGERCYPSLKDIPFPVEVVDIFRRVEAIPLLGTGKLDLKRVKDVAMAEFCPGP